MAKKHGHPKTLQKPWKNKRLRLSGRQAPGSGAMRPPAARPGITMPYHGNHWETISFSMFGQIAYDAFCCVPLRRMENLMVIGKPWRTQWGNMVSGPWRSKIKDSPPTVTFPGKEQSQNLTYGNQWKTYENHWFGKPKPRFLKVIRTSGCSGWAHGSFPGTGNVISSISEKFYFSKFSESRIFSVR